ncbi:MAG: DUF4857 domain-containing protein [Campylobacteraceae bacterium]|nr:DUF4857 domain-containing protein [Campylobacteraceae bacterium]
MRKFIQIFILVLVLAIFLPRFIEVLFKAPRQNANVSHSEVHDEFMVQASKNKEIFYFKGKDENLSLEEYLDSLPFSFYTYLITNNRFPYDEWKDANAIKANSQKFAIKPDAFNQKYPPIFTIFESNPKYLRLGYNEFAITSNKFELIFTDLNTLKKDENLSKTFTNSLLNLGFDFPVRAHFTNPSTKKPFDEGVFLKDSKSELFHLKIKNNAPVAKKTDIKNVDFMLISENERREFYGAVIDRSGVSLVSYDDYKLINLPSKHYGPTTDRLELTITPLSKSMSIKKQNEVHAYHFDEKYNVLKSFEYEFNQPNRAEMIKKAILPFEISLADSYDYKFKITNFSLNSLWLNLALFVLAFFIFRKKSLVKPIFALLFGIYGFLAVLAV